MEKQIKNWTYEEGKALIAAYGDRKQEYDRCRNKNDFWQNILTDIETMNVLVSATTVEQVTSKWKTMYRAYKPAVDSGTGDSSSKFMYLEEMDEIFSENPLMHSKHVVSVGVDKEPTPAPTFDSVNNVQPREDEEVVLSNRTLHPKRKRKNENQKENLLSVKKNYYEQVVEEKKRKRELMEQYLEKKEANKERRHKEILEALKILNK